MQESEKQLLKEKLPLWLQERGYPLKRSFRCLNPQHEDKHPSMRYFAKTNTVHCFSCGATYDIFQLVGMEEGLDGFPKQLQRIRERYGLQGKQERKELPTYWEKTEQKDFTQFVAERKNDRPQQLMEWFAARGIPKDAVEKYGFFHLEGRAIFPIWNRGVCVSWCGRSLQDTEQPRYRNSVGKMGIWGIDRLYEAGNEPIAICEGVLDAVSLELCGCPAIALCGASGVGRLIKELEGLTTPLPPFILAGDADTAGQQMSDQLQRWLTAHGGCCVGLSLPEGYKDANAAWVAVPQQLQQALKFARREVLTLSVQQEEEYGQESMAALSGAFLEYLDRCQESAVLSSGLSEVDKLLGGGIFAGLYVLGAPSSLGKTTLLLQMADEIAAAGRDVLFFSLEMGRWELLAKSLCRMAGEQSGLSVRQLLQGGCPRAQVEQLLTAYNRRCGNRVFVITGDGSLTPTAVAAKAREHRERRGSSPVVIVDYLQILAPSDPRSSDKQNVDRAVVTLKALSRDLETPVFVASSFNRDGYTKAVSMEAFKESGAVEYAADVLLALQMTAMDEADFDMDREKVQDPRREDLVLLKNRNGVPYGKVSLRYYGAANLFVQAGEAVSTARQTVRRIGRKQ